MDFFRNKRTTALAKSNRKQSDSEFGYYILCQQHTRTIYSILRVFILLIGSKNNKTHTQK